MVSILLFEALKVEEIPEPQVLAECIFMLALHRPSRPPLLLEQPGGGSPQCFLGPMQEIQNHMSAS